MAATDDVFRTAHEIAFLKGLFEKDQAGFVKMADAILSKRRTYSGEGMHVNVPRVMEFCREKLAQIESTAPPPPKAERPFSYRAFDQSKIKPT